MQEQEILELQRKLERLEQKLREMDANIDLIGKSHIENGKAIVSLQYRFFLARKFLSSLMVSRLKGSIYTWLQMITKRSQ